MTFRALSILCLSLPCSLAADNALIEWWQAHGDYRVVNLTSVLAQEPAEIPLFDSLPEPENPLNLPETSLINELRPEASLSFDRLFLEAKPRFIARRDYYRSGQLDGEERNGTETYLHEWIAQVFLTPELSVSYGREDLQWGPAFLLSPSNPFDSRNGRSEPKDEVEAADYARVVWTPNFSWTVSAIWNTDDGRKNYRIRDELRQDFRDGYALKVDYLFDRGSASLLASTKDEADEMDRRLGYTFSYNINDAWIAYSEGSASEVDEEFLLGGSYTFTSGLNLALEYFYNSSGIDAPIPEDPIDLYELDDFVLSLPNRENFFRENYLLLQAYQNDVLGRFDLILRYTRNLDDRSSSLLGHAEVDLNDYAQFFTSATLNSDEAGELDSLREYWVQAGIELSF